MFITHLEIKILYKPDPAENNADDILTFKFYQS